MGLRCFNGAELAQMVELASIHISMNPSLEKWCTFTSIHASMETILKNGGACFCPCINGAYIAWTSGGP